MDFCLQLSTCSAQTDVFKYREILAIIQSHHHAEPYKTRNDILDLRFVDSFCFGWERNDNILVPRSISYYKQNIFTDLNTNTSESAVARRHHAENRTAQKSVPADVLHVSGYGSLAGGFVPKWSLCRAT